jgi:hypothetical protein
MLKSAKRAMIFPGASCGDSTDFRAPEIDLRMVVIVHIRFVISGVEVCVHH